MPPDESDGGSSRPGPVPLPDDTWDTAPTRGRHHVRRHRVPPRYLVVILILAVTALVPAVVVPLALPDEPSGDQTGDRDPVAGGSPGATTPTATTPGATTGAAMTAPAVTASATLAPVVTTAAGTKPAAPAGGAVPPEGLVYEAEAGPPDVRLRRAEVVALGDGAGVQFTSRSGQIEFDPRVPTQDRYRVTIVYAAEDDRRIEVSGSRDSERVRLSRTSGCCASVTVEVRLSPDGDLTIEPSGGSGQLPIIDRIIIAPA